MGFIIYLFVNESSNLLLFFSDQSVQYRIEFSSPLYSEVRDLVSNADILPSVDTFKEIRLHLQEVLQVNLFTFL